MEQHASSPLELSDRELEVLRIEATPWPRRAAKEAAIRERLGLSPARYYQVLNSLLESPLALRHDPLLVHRLRRLRDARVGARAARGFPRAEGHETR